MVEAKKLNVTISVKRLSVQVNKTTACGGHESVRSELDSKRQLLSELSSLEDELTALIVMISELPSSSFSLPPSPAYQIVLSERYKQELEMETARATLAQLTVMLEQNIDQLSKADSQWTLLQEKIHSVCEKLKFEVNSAESKVEDEHDVEDQVKDAQVG